MCKFEETVSRCGKSVFTNNGKNKTEYYQNIVKEKAHDQGRLFRTSNAVMHREKPNPIPSSPKDSKAIVEGLAIFSPKK